MEREQFQNDPSRLSYDKDLHQNASMDLDFTTFLAMFSIFVIFYYLWKMIQRKAEINTNSIDFIPERKGDEKKTPLFEEIKFKSPQKKDENNTNNNNNNQNNSSGNKKDKANNGSNKKAPSSDNKKKNSDHQDQEATLSSHLTPVKEKNKKSEEKGKATKEEEEIDFLSPISSVIAKTRLAKTQLKKRRSSYGLVDHSLPMTNTNSRTTVKKSITSSSYSSSSRPVTRSSQRYCPINVLEKNTDQLGGGIGERERGGAGSSDSSSISVSMTVQ
jgi:E3 ubiquitin-protein ligase DOA10